jgi:hypothetical protein
MYNHRVKLSFFFLEALVGLLSLLGYCMATFSLAGATELIHYLGIHSCMLDTYHSYFVQ